MSFYRDLAIDDFMGRFVSDYFVSCEFLAAFRAAFIPFCVVFQNFMQKAFY